MERRVCGQEHAFVFLCGGGEAACRVRNSRRSERGTETRAVCEDVICSRQEARYVEFAKNHAYAHYTPLLASSWHANRAGLSLLVAADPPQGREDSKEDRPDKREGHEDSA